MSCFHIIKIIVHQFFSCPNSINIINIVWVFYSPLDPSENVLKSLFIRKIVSQRICKIDYTSEKICCDSYFRYYLFS